MYRKGISIKEIFIRKKYILNSDIKNKYRYKKIIYKKKTSI